MSRKLCLAGVLAISLMAARCAQFETSSQTLTPSAPPPLAGGSSNGELVGIWLPEMGVAAPSPSSCGNFQWEITSQSATAVQGNFSAECGGGVTISASVAGVLTSPSTVALNVTGTGYINGLGCPFTLNGVGTIFDDNYAITIPYTGTTCFGPVSGTETVRRPRPQAPPPPNPEPPPPGENPNHVGPGPLSDARAEQVSLATSNEFSHLLAPTNDVNQKIANAEEMLLRVIWHLQLAGYNAARQRNPSGAVSNDKLAVFLTDDNRWHTYDIMTNFDIPGATTRMIWFHIEGANPVPSGGIPD
jgi:hypothetical protein